jgi:lysophospholipase L1-like esterase
MGSLTIKTNGQTLVAASFTNQAGTTQPLYSDAALTSQVSLPATITADTTYYARDGLCVPTIKQSDGTALWSTAVHVRSEVNRTISPLPSFEQLAEDTANLAATFGQLQRSGIVVWGDSHFENGGGDSAGQSSATFKTLRTRGAVNWALARLRQRGKLLHNGGVGGERTDQILARFATDVSAYNPGIVVLNGGTNDISQLVTASAGTVTTTVATIKTNLTAAINLIIGIGARPLVVTLPPNSAYSANQLLAWAQVNRWITSLPTTVKGVTVCDWTPPVVSTAGAWATGMTYDNTHASSIGAARMSVPLAAALDKLLPAQDPLPAYTDSMDLLTNGSMTGTGGTAGTGITGSVAAGWLMLPSTGTVTAVASKVVRTDNVPGEWQQIAISAVGASSNGVRLFRDIDAGKWSVGDVVVGYAEFETDSDLTVSSLSQFFFQIVVITATGNAWALYNANTDSLNDPTCRLSSGVLRTMPFTIPSGATGFRAHFEVDGATGTFRVGRVSVVNLTTAAALGLTLN